MKKLIYFLFPLLYPLQLAAQNNTIHVPEDQLVTGKTYTMDTIINGKAYFVEVKNQSPKIDIDLTAFKRAYKDDSLAASIDKKWLKLLYNNTIYDTLRKDIIALNYKSVYYPELSTDTLKARLQTINAKTPFNVAYNPALESVIKQFLKRRKKSLQKLMKLSAFYFPLFENELANQNLPLELKYLPIVESALKPRAKSRVGATGLWQFMFGTGKEYGLEVSTYVDERSDPIQSTQAAVNYLSKLYSIFGDWDLVLAAYNSGPGNVTKAIRRSGGYKNYWNIRPFLPQETAGYVPAFLATMYIFEYANEHGFTPDKPEQTYIETDTVKVKHMIALDHITELTGVPIEELQFLNPSYKLDIIPYIKNKDYYLRLPRYAVGAFVANENAMYAYAKAQFEKREKPLPELVKAESKIRYKVKSGDYLGKIARKYKVRVSQIKGWNGLRNNNLRVGQRLTIYPRQPIAVSKKTTAAITNKKTYTVQSGDSLWGIAKKFSGISVENIKEWNDISGTTLKPGTVLKLTKK